MVRLRRHTRALPILVAVVALGCASVQGGRLYTSGSEALDRGDLEQAVTELEQAARLVPEAAPVYNNLGVAYLTAGRPADAERAFQRAVALDCSHEPAKRNLRALRSTPVPEAVAQQP